jgi:hypothetical protein
MSRKILPLLTLAAALLLAACGSPSEAGPDKGLTASTRAHSLFLTNTTSEPVYWFAVESSTAARIDFFGCYDPVRCPSISPGHTRRLPYDSIEGYSPGAEKVIIYWWHLVPDAQRGFRMERMNSILVEL